jgi:hypothetical protein
MVKVEVRPIELEKWHGKKGKESFTQARVIEVLYDSKLGGYATGLTPEEEEKYSKLMGVDLSSTFNYEKPHPYWGSRPAQIKLENATNIFNLENPVDYVKVKNLKASRFVANSVKDLEEGLYPDAMFVIYDEDEEVEKKATKVQLKNKAIASLTKMSLDEKTNICTILSSKNVKGRSQDFIDVEIDKLIEISPSEFLKYAKMDKAETAIRATVLEAIYKNILTKEKGSIYYMSERIGIDYEDAVSWFSDPQNQKIKIAILEKLNK